MGPKRRPVIGLCGFYGHGNFGDELFLKVHEANLGDVCDLVVIPSLLEKPYFPEPLAELVSKVDALLIGGGDLMRPWGVDVRYFHRLYLTKPVFIAGIGVPVTYREDGTEQETEHSLNRYREFLTHPNVKFINVRDPASKDWIHRKLGRSIELSECPDLVCGLDLPTVKDKSSVPMLGIATRNRPNQSDDYAQLEALAQHYHQQGWKVRQLVLGIGPTGERDFEDANNFRFPHKELVYLDNLDDISRAIGECHAFASMKFHGTVVATMYGIPSVVLIPTQKNISFMSRLNREKLISRFDAPDLLAKAAPPLAGPTPDQLEYLRTSAKGMLQALRNKILAEVGTLSGDA